MSAYSKIPCSCGSSVTTNAMGRAAHMKSKAHRERILLPKEMIDAQTRGVLPEVQKEVRRKGVRKTDGEQPTAVLPDVGMSGVGSGTHEGDAGIRAIQGVSSSDTLLDTTGLRAGAPGTPLLQDGEGAPGGALHVEGAAFSLEVGQVIERGGRIFVVVRISKRGGTVLLYGATIGVIFETRLSSIWSKPTTLVCEMASAREACDWVDSRTGHPERIEQRKFAASSLQDFITKRLQRALLDDRSTTVVESPTQKEETQ